MKTGDRFRATDDFNRRIQKLVNRDSPLVGRVGTIIYVPRPGGFPYATATFEGLEETYIVDDGMIQSL